MIIKLFASLEEANKEVPLGTMRKLIIKENPYLLIHASDGFSVSNFLCPHQNEPLANATLNGFNEIICPLHEYRFNLKTGMESSNRCGHLSFYQIAEKSDGLYIEI